MDKNARQIRVLAEMPPGASKVRENATINKVIVNRFHLTEQE